jgi:hypothetical protein
MQFYVKLLYVLRICMKLGKNFIKILVAEDTYLGTLYFSNTCILFLFICLPSLLTQNDPSYVHLMWK